MTEILAGVPPPIQLTASTTRAWLVSGLPWLMSGITIAQVWAAGNKAWWAWKLSLISQGLWLAWILLSANWGLLPMNFVLSVIAYRNDRKWQADRRLNLP